MKSDKATVEGKTVHVGDVVCFKSDIEQCGTIKEIRRNSWGGVVLVVGSERGFQGEYIGGQTSTIVSAADCWIE